MGDEVSRVPVMAKTGWWLVDMASRLLEPGEREAVRGDLTESGAGSVQAFRDVVGLVARRQAAMWIDWRPWLALVGIVLPIGMLLSYTSRWLADGSALEILRPGAYLGYPGWRHDPVPFVVSTFLGGVVLSGWSWTSGFVLGSLSRRTLWVTATLFCFVVLLGTVGTTTTARAYHADVFALRFYGVVLPRLVRTFLVLLPAWLGMRASLRGRQLPPLPMIAGAIAIAILTAGATTSLEGAVTFGWYAILADGGPAGAVTVNDVRLLWLLPLVMIWPAAYIVATTAVNRSRSKTGRAGLAS
jgi:hypothetical protein